jgi:hypothetical protein
VVLRGRAETRKPIDNSLCAKVLAAGETGREDLLDRAAEEKENDRLDCLQSNNVLGMP